MLRFFFKDDPENILKFEFDDEEKSLLSANLWDLGLDSTNQDEAARKIADEQIDCVKGSNKQTKIYSLNKGDQESARGLSEIEIIDFKGKSFAVSNCTLFESVMLSRESGQGTFKTRFFVFSLSRVCFS